MLWIHTPTWFIQWAQLGTSAFVSHSLKFLSGHKMLNITQNKTKQNQPTKKKKKLRHRYSNVGRWRNRTNCFYIAFSSAHGWFFIRSFVAVIKPQIFGFLLIWFSLFLMKIHWKRKQKWMEDVQFFTLILKCSKTVGHPVFHFTSDILVIKLLKNIFLPYASLGSIFGLK